MIKTRITSHIVSVFTAGILVLPVDSAFSALVSYRNTILADNPIVYYEFDETSGTTADNIGSGGAANDGTITSTVTVNQSSYLDLGTAYDFGGGRVISAAIPT